MQAKYTNIPWLSTPMWGENRLHIFTHSTMYFGDVIKNSSHMERKPVLNKPIQIYVANNNKN